MRRVNKHNTKIHTKSYGYVDVEYDVNWTMDSEDNEWVFNGVVLSNLDPDSMPTDLAYSIISDYVIESGRSPLDTSGEADEDTHYAD